MCVVTANQTRPDHCRPDRHLRLCLWPKVHITRRLPTARLFVIDRALALLGGQDRTQGSSWGGALPSLHDRRSRDLGDAPVGVRDHRCLRTRRNQRVTEGHWARRPEYPLRRTLHARSTRPNDDVETRETTSARSRRVSRYTVCPMTRTRPSPWRSLGLTGSQVAPRDSQLSDVATSSRALIAEPDDCNRQFGTNRDSMAIGNAFVRISWCTHHRA